MIRRFKLRSAVYLILIRDEKILLSKRQNTGWEDGNYTLISGHLDGDETVVSAMVREAYEEANIVIHPDDLRIVGVMHRRSNYEYIDFFLTTNKWKGEIENAEPEKCKELSWFGLDDLPLNLIESVKKALSNFQKGIYFSEYGF